MKAPCFEQTLKVSAAQCSEAGIKPQNEDSIGIHIPTGSQLACKGVAAVIADGVSAADAGKQAAEASVTGFLNDYFSTPELWSVKQSAHRVLIAINRWLYGQSQHYIDQRKGYVCTFSALILKSQSAYIFHVGDSRIYRYRDGELEQLTQDHIAQISEQKQYLARALGIDLNLDVDFMQLDLEPDDVFICTTDGVHDWVPGKSLRGIVSSHAVAESFDAESLTRALLEAALANNSDDNLSCQVIKIDSLGLPTNEDAVNRLATNVFPPALATGMRLDGLLVERELFASQRSQVYLVKDPANGAHYAMKTPSKNYEDDPAYIERFIMEEWVGSRVASPFVVDVKPPPQPRSFLYYLMDYLDGPTLTAHMKSSGLMDIKEAVTLTEKIVKGVRAFHRRETLHQDLKPDNIILKAGEPVIIDFGSVFVAGVDEIRYPIAQEVPLGTFEYSAPEYRLKRPRSEKSDQFSIAVILYEMLTGKHPYGDRYEAAENIHAVSRLEYTPAYVFNPHVPLWLDGALKRALSINADLRYDALSEFVHDLKTPNPRYLHPEQKPLLESNPLRTWQLISVILLLTQLVTLMLWLG